MIISASVCRLRSHRPTQPHEREPHRRQDRHPPAGRDHGDGRRAHDHAEERHALQREQELVVDGLRDVLDRREEVHEQRARVPGSRSPTARGHEDARRRRTARSRGTRPPSCRPITTATTAPASQSGHRRRASGAAATVGGGSASATGAGRLGASVSAISRVLDQRGQHGLAVDDADHRVALHHADRRVPRRHHRDQLLDHRGRGDGRTVAVPIAVDRPHDRPRREHVGARHVAREVGDVVVGRVRDDLLRRPDLDERARPS